MNQKRKKRIPNQTKCLKVQFYRTVFSTLINRSF